jgi:hypothetical protein
MPEITPPRSQSTPFGSIMLLGNSGNIFQDVFEALKQMDALKDTNITGPEDVNRLMTQERISRGLQEEAGCRVGPYQVCFHNQGERLATGVRILSTLRLLHSSPYGDCIAWIIGATDNNGSYSTVICSNRTQVEAVFALLRAAAKGPSTDMTSDAIPIPSKNDLSDMG